MNSKKECSYCLSLTKFEIKQKTFNCSCKICKVCIEFLLKSSQISCPLCSSNISQNYKNSSSLSNPKNYSLFNKTKLNPEQQSLLQSLNQTSESINLQIENSKNSKRIAKEMNLVYLTLKILEKTSNLIDFPANLSEKLSIMRDLKIFKYSKIRIILPFNYYSICTFALNNLSDYGLTRERYKLIDPEKCYFIGKELFFSPRCRGYWSHKFEVLDGRPCELVEIGIGMPIGYNAVSILNGIIIVENGIKKYSDCNANYQMRQTDARITFGVTLRNRIKLHIGNKYEIIYRDSENNIFLTDYKENIVDLGPIKIKFIDSECTYSSILYFKIE